MNRNLQTCGRFLIKEDAILKNKEPVKRKDA